MSDPSLPLSRDQVIARIEEVRHNASLLRGHVHQAQVQALDACLTLLRQPQEPQPNSGEIVKRIMAAVGQPEMPPKAWIEWVVAFTLNLARQPQEPQWQPIETAPKDGKKLLLWWRSEFSDGVAYWACGHWQEFGDGSKGWIGESFHASEPDYWTRILGERPTHWTALPSPPSGADQ